MNKLLVLYHANCLDGVAAAWAVRFFRSDAELVPVNYSDAPPDVTDRDVVIVDFSYKRPMLLEMKAKAKSLLVLDHHKSAQAELEGLDFCIFDMESSGCGLTWDYFSEGLYDIPQLLLHIEDRDLWRFNYPYTKEITAALFSYELTPDLIEEKLDSIDELVAEGSALCRLSNSSVRKMISKDVQLWHIGGFDVPVVNTSLYASEVGNALAQNNTFGVTYYDSADGQCFSLRSVGMFDVSEIAKLFGGGGHRNAAGFFLKYSEYIYTSIIYPIKKV